MTNLIPVSTLVESQLPGYIVQNTNGKLQRFLEYYYEFLESEGEYDNFVRSITKYVDSDRSPETVIDSLFEEFAEIPHLISVDKRLFLKNIYDFYKTKGTENSFRLLFRAFFNTEIEIDYPSKNILRASDGKWSQEIQIVVQTTYGSLASLDTNVVQFTSSGEIGPIYKKSSACIPIDSTAYQWLKFPASSGLNTNVGDTVRQLDANGTITFVGNVVSVPVSIEVVAPGQRFRIGQVFRIPGAYRDTIFRVASLTAIGGIKTTQILQFGFGHTSGLISTFTPYGTQPSGSTFSYNRVTLSPGIYRYELNMSETLFNISDKLTGSYISDNWAPGYVESGYTATEFTPLDGGTPTNGSGAFVSPGNTLSIEEYLASIASVRINEGSISRYKGKYLTSDSMLSNPSIVLQDNYYYQAYSYVISSSHKVSEYKDTILRLAHPAGMKFFGNMTKEVTFDIFDSIFADSQKTYFLEFNELIDSITDSIGRSVMLGKSESLTVSESLGKSTSQVYTDTFTSSETLGKGMFESFADSLASPTESFGISYNKSVIEPQNSDAIRYAVPGYWAEDYGIISDNKPNAVTVTDSINVA